MSMTSQNPLGTEGFSFVEYAAPDAALLRDLFEKLGFSAIAKHRGRDITLHRQGAIDFLINGEGCSFAGDFAFQHGPAASSMAFRVADRDRAFAEALKRGATEAPTDEYGNNYDLPVLEGIGGSRLYLTDEPAGALPSADFKPLPDADMAPKGAGLTEIDHLTHNVMRGNMEKWAGFYERVFNFRELKYFDIEGKLTGLVSKAMVSPCGHIRIPINESRDDKSQIEEYLHEYKGEGIQHIALSTEDIYATVDDLKGRGITFQDTPDTYYEQIDERLPGHGEDVERLKERRILIDGAPAEGAGLLLQIFTVNVIGPIFYEIIQRKGNEGFGEGNFKALFESIELDQIRRGVLEAS